MNFQELILTLNKFWAEQNCIIQQPYDIEKGAGTMNPATFLRALRPEPWRGPMWNHVIVLLTVPSGENPARL